ncbi:MAG: hypothetical protein ACE145_15600 [Terriglobia bacterium]
MNLNRMLRASTVTLLVLGLTLSLGLAQDQSSSLGDLARQLKAQREKAAKKPVKVFSNDNLPKRPPGETLTMASGMSQEVPPPPAESSLSAAGEGSSGAHDEKYFRARMAELRERLETHQRELAVLQQKASQGQTQYYADPNKTLQQEFSRSDVNKATNDVAKMQQQISDDEKAMDDLRDQLRREGGEPGWLR